VAADFDHDGVGNCTDCAPTDPTAHTFPAEILQFRITAIPNQLRWNQLPLGAYDVVRGEIPSLPIGPAETVCVANSQTPFLLTDATEPVEGVGFYYLVRGQNACGTGTFGTGSGGLERPADACP